MVRRSGLYPIRISINDGFTYDTMTTGRPFDLGRLIGYALFRSVRSGVNLLITIKIEIQYLPIGDYDGQ